MAKELRKEIGENSEHSKDLDLLISQTKRCGEILKNISQNKILEDKFIIAIKIEDLLGEITNSFKDTHSKEINLVTDKNKNKINILRSPEIIYGLRNFIGNAVKFSKDKVDIVLESNANIVRITINDDGPGFAEDVIEILGEPYIKSKSEISSKSGLGLGTFLGKTLLERQGAKLNFSNNVLQGGAIVSITWNCIDLKFNF